MKFKRQAEAIKEIRIARGLSQWEFASLMGIHGRPGGQFVSNCERGLCCLPTFRLRKLKLTPQEKLALVSAKLNDVREEFLKDLG